MDEEKNVFDVSNLIPNIDVRTVDYSKILPLMKSSAQQAYENLVEYINEFEKNLDEEHEIGARLVSFGNSVSFHMQNIGYYGPDIITFYGVNSNSEKVQLVQHVSQLNVLLVAMKKIGEKPIRIGFKLQKEHKQQKMQEEKINQNKEKKDL